MISGIFHEGSGLGNQLHRYVATRVFAADRGLDFGMVNPAAFKAASFMNLDMGLEVPGSFQIERTSGRVTPIDHGMSFFTEKSVIENGIDIRGYDPDVNFIEDNTLIDGEFQDERYFNHHLEEINDWLKVEYLGMPNNVCIIGFRGGEFTAIPDLFLSQDYWEQAIAYMQLQDPTMIFHVVTDDPVTARAYFPAEIKIFHDISTDWRMVRHARWLILANSSFYILPALLNRHVREVIAPKYWARRNKKVWATSQNYYTKFLYL